MSDITSNCACHTRRSLGGCILKSWNAFSDIFSMTWLKKHSPWPMKKWPSISTLPPIAKHVLSDHQLPCLLSIEQLPLIHLQHFFVCRRIDPNGPVKNLVSFWNSVGIQILVILWASRMAFVKFNHPSYSTNSAPVPKMLPEKKRMVQFRKKVPCFHSTGWLKGDLYHHIYHLIMKGITTLEMTWHCSIT